MKVAINQVSWCIEHDYHCMGSSGIKAMKWFPLSNFIFLGILYSMRDLPHIRKTQDHHLQEFVQKSVSSPFNAKRVYLGIKTDT